MELKGESDSSSSEYDYKKIIPVKIVMKSLKNFLKNQKNQKIKK